MIKDESIILFDGVCNLCNGFVRWVLKFDKKKHFKFCSLQSAKGQEILDEYKLFKELQSVVLINQNVSYIKSDAVLQILKQFNFPLNLLVLAKFIPKFLRDKLYDFVAKYRYRIFGKTPMCIVPSAEVKDRFLD